MSKILPPFTTLLAFDAAARHGTFTRAAAELNVSQPAISRRIALLEEDLGFKLFERTSKPMSLTKEGTELFEVLRSGLSRLETVVSDMRGRHSQRKFTIAAYSGFLSFWLMPKLPELRRNFPNLNLRLITSDYDKGSTGSDITIRFGAGEWDNLQYKKMLDEEVYAVCSPQYLENRDKFLSLADLAQEQLLELSDAPERWFDWKRWFTEVGANQISPKKTLEFDSYSMLVGAAVAGEGVALCWSGLLDAFIQQGSLIRASEEVATSNQGYYATYDSSIEPDSITMKVVDWLCSYRHIP
ncbi:LysR substrate-binding domain-containing protein [Curvivirga sp.]|uniref:LysR substrate-binding domain-containing protein n=1 Tax=Curvivirga sp. TaxID=2856848 RepID=UPI003B5A7CC1